jgi:hypothetical protein
VVSVQIDVTMNVYTEVSDARTLNALKRLGRQLGSQALLYFAAAAPRGAVLYRPRSGQR